MVSWHEKWSPFISIHNLLLLPPTVVVVFVVAASTTPPLLLLLHYPDLGHREKAKSMFYHGYDGYLTYAYPYDELKPLSCSGQDTWGRSVTCDPSRHLTGCACSGRASF